MHKKRSDNQGSKELIDKLVKLRHSKGMSQKQLAEKTGLSQQAISRIECGAYAPSLKTLLRIVKALNARIEFRESEETDV